VRPSGEQRRVCDREVRRDHGVVARHGRLTHADGARITLLLDRVHTCALDDRHALAPEVGGEPVAERDRIEVCLPVESHR
jgi:hypothetical protein